MVGVIENVIEFLKDQEIATVTFSQRRYISRIKKLAKERPDECEIVAENKDGSIMAHIPVKWVRINPGKNMTDEVRAEYAERFRRTCGMRFSGKKTDSCLSEDS